MLKSTGADASKAYADRVPGGEFDALLRDLPRRNRMRKRLVRLQGDAERASDEPDEARRNGEPASHHAGMNFSATPLLQ